MLAVMSDALPPSLPPPIPIPVQALPYSTGATQGRPGMVIAIAVLSIVIASLSGIVSFLVCVYGLIFYTMISTWASSPAFTPGMGGGVMATTPAAPALPSKLSMGDSTVAVNSLRSMLDLDGARIRELDKLMRAHGREILGNGSGEDDDPIPSPLTEPGIRESVGEHHTASNADSPAVFVTALGRVEVYHNRAQFVSTDGTHTISSSAANNSESETTADAPAGNQSTTMQVNSSFHVVSATTQSQGTTLSPAEVRGIMKKIRQFPARPLTAAQVAAVQSQLSAPNQLWVTPGSTSPVQSIIPAPDGVIIQFELGQLKVGPQGQILMAVTSNPFTGFANLKGLRGPVAMLIAEAAASLGLAIYLLVVGILACRASFGSPGLLRIFAWIKIVLVLLGVNAVMWLLHNSYSVAGSPPPIATIVVWIVLCLAICLAFPIGLLISLRTRVMRDYFTFVAT
jgi:hypothetical protein